MRIKGLPRPRFRLAHSVGALLLIVRVLSDAAQVGTRDTAFLARFLIPINLRWPSSGIAAYQKGERWTER